LINPTAPYFSTYYGGTEDDYITGVAQTSDTVLFNICGYTESDTNSQKFPLQILAGPYITYGGNGDGFVAGLLKKLPVQTGYPGYNNQWAVYCGGSGYDRVNDIAFDKNDVTINITGETNSSDFPIKHAFQNQIVNLFDAFAAKYFAPVGHKLWSTYFGGEDFECGIGVTTTDSNGVVISGTALDGLLTTPWAYQPDYAGNGYDRDAFVAKFSNLTALPTYVGGELDDFIEDMFVDQEGYIYITGITYSSDFPVLDGYDESYNGDGDIFITKFNNIGFKMFSTFYGGDSTDHGMAIVKDYYNEQSDLYVTGYTKSSSGIGYTGSGDPLSTTYNYLEDGFLLKISNDGMTRRWCTYLAGGYRDFCTGVCLNNDESNIYVTGYTQSPYFDPYSPTINLNNHYSLFVYINYDAFVTKFDTDGAGIWNEFIGGDEDDFSNDIDYVRNLDQVAIVGSTNSQYGFPLMNETKDQTGYIIGKAPNPVSFVGVIDEEGNNIFCSHYGGSVNSNYALAVYSSNDETNNTFFVGYTSDGVSENFPYNNQDGYQQVYGGGEFDGFVATLLTDQDDNWQTIDGSFLGGDSVDFANEISGKGDDIYIVGQTGFRWYNYLPSGSFPYAKYPYISGNYSDAFLIKMNKDLSELNMGTYYGANKLDVANAVGLDPLGNPIVAGVSYYDAGSDIHDIDYWAEQPTRGGECDGFLVKFNRGGLYFAKESVHENEITNEYLNLLLYPNPSIQNITIQLKMHESSNVLFEITNLLGEKVFSKSSPCSTIDYNETIDIHSLSSGVYCLTVTNKDKKRSKMFIKE
jgi:hypothetical protein